MSAVSVRGTASAVGAGAVEARVRLRGMTALDSVRRNLFGSEGREESRRFVERELSRQLELDSQRWGFDFAHERPLAGHGFSWQRVVLAPELSPALRCAAPAQLPPTPAPPAPVPAAQDASVKPQKRITDYLKPRKRLSGSAKKSSPAHKHDCSGHGAHVRPPKVARLAQAHCKRS